ncbi:hypothetical protein [Arsukibacterium ikkense]|uniref:hypothetical protein n=1 Tax=Arsukibacterium ikkense TaxID=336831 RepID=UPI00128C44E6|nr:hypothetical protein [Arsukibacterium ikkense]
MFLILIYLSLFEPAWETPCERYLSIEHLSEQMTQTLLDDYEVTEQVNGVEIIADKKNTLLQQFITTACRPSLSNKLIALV